MTNIIILDYEEKQSFPTSNKCLGNIFLSLNKIYNKFNCFLMIRTLKDNRGKSLIISSNLDSDNLLLQNNLNFKRFKDYKIVKESTLQQRKAFSFMQELPNEVWGLDISYENMSLWEMDESDIYNSFILPTVLNIEIIKKIIKKENAKSLIVIDSSSPIGKIQKQFKDEINVIDKTNLLSKVRNVVFNLLTPIAVKSIHSEYVKCLRDVNYKPRKVRDIVTVLNQRGIEIAYPFLKPFFDKLTIVKEHDSMEKVFNADYQNLSHFVDNISRGCILDFQEILKEHLTFLENTVDYERKMIYQGINIKSILKPMIKYLFLNSYVKSVFYYEAFKKMYKLGKPKLCLITCKAQRHERIHLLVANNNHVKSLFVMHGLLHSNDYLYTINDYLYTI